MEDKLIKLSEATKCNFTLEFNPHKSVYESAEKYFRGMDYDIVGDLDYDKDIWSIQIYPRTPVGFIFAISNNPYELLDWAIEGAKEY